MSSLCRSSPFSSRTKSLREKFASKRSYSESFKDPPAGCGHVRGRLGSTGCLLSQVGASFDNYHSRFSLSDISRSPPRPESGPGYLSHSSGSADAASGLVMPPSLPGFIPSYTAMPEDAYCSALDINCQQGDPRFPWQRDAAVQCDIRGTSLVNSRSSTHIDGGRCSPGLSSLLRPSSPAAATRAGSSVGDIFSTSAAGSPPAPPPRRSTPALQRALSLERSAARKKAASSLLPGHASTSASSGSQLPPALEEGGTASGSASAGNAASAIRAASCSPQRAQQPVSPEPSSSPKSGQASPAVTRSSPGETTPPLTRRPSAAERRKMCFVRKQTNSAPKLDGRGRAESVVVFGVQRRRRRPIHGLVLPVAEHVGRFSAHGLVVLRHRVRQPTGVLQLRVHAAPPRPVHEGARRAKGLLSRYPVARR
ncbi:hypothetical protein MRX96_007836 [Rhipicephalus microplus]